MRTDAPPVAEYGLTHMNGNHNRSSADAPSLLTGRDESRIETSFGERHWLEVQLNQTDYSATGTLRVALRRYRTLSNRSSTYLEGYS
jgi:hypothetical protein